MSPFDLIDPQYGWLNPDQEDQGIPVPAAPGLVANAPTPSFLDRLKGLFMPSRAQAAEPQGGGMDIGALLPGMILTQLGQQMQLPRNQRNPAAIPQAIMGVIKAQQGSQEEKQKLAMQKLLFLNELQKGKTPTTIEAAVLKAQAEGKSPEEIEQLIGYKRKLEKPTEEKVPTTVQAAILKRMEAGQPYDDLMAVHNQLQKEPAEKTPQLFQNPDNPKEYAWVVPGGVIPPGMVPRTQTMVVGKEIEKKEDKETLAEMYYNGELNPDLLSKRGDFNSITALAKKNHPDFNPSQTMLRWYDAKKRISSLDSTQQARLEAVGLRIENTVPLLQELAGQLNGKAKDINDAAKQAPPDLGITGVGPINKLKLEWYVKYRGNTPEGQLATRYLTTINDMKEQIAQSASGGYAPTEPAWALANKQMNENFGIEQMQATLDQLRTIARINVNAGKEMRQQVLSMPLGPNQNQQFLQPQTGNLNLQNMTRDDLKKLSPAQLMQLRNNFPQGGR